MIPKDSDFQPAATLRPHHFFFKEFLLFFVSMDDPKFLSVCFGLKYDLARKNLGDDGLIKDTIGKSAQDRVDYQRNLQLYGTHLRELLDSSCIFLDLQPDGICQSCTIGKHCTATNFFITPTKKHAAFDTIRGESRDLKRIRHRLDQHGYQLGVDFIESSTRHVLRDLNSEILNSNEIDHPVLVDFDSLIVKTFALRNLARLELAHPNNDTNS